ncbi:MAG: zinc-ribbon domain-containing protein [Polyangiaceae bacterium]
MDVTCERCGTEYDFDDALVSERGTTVKCTNCGAQFRVYRPVPAGGPERWVVRTVDGRELVFSALRELQAAISTGAVGREDVLSRGAGRPRRLGSIAELEPFFKQAIVIAATSTAPGLGLPTPRVPTARYEGSVAIPLPRGPEEPPRRSGTLPPPPPVLDPPSGDRSEIRARGANGASGNTAAWPPPGDANPVINTSVSGSMQPTSVAASGNAVRLQNLVAADLAEPITVPRADAIAQSIAQDRTVPVPIGPAPTQHAPPIGVSAHTGRAEPAQARSASAPAAAAPAAAAAAATSNAAYAETIAAIHEPAARAAPAREPAPSDDPPPARRREESGVVEKVGAPPSSDSKSSREAPSDRRKPISTPLPPMTPTPGNVRVSYIPEPEPSVSPRFSMAAMSTRRNTSVRWIVGVVLVGAVALLAATVGRKYLTTPAPTAATAPAADERVTRLLEEGEKALSEGDLDSAKEKLDKASALAENNPQVASHLAHLEVVRADQRWLKVRILPPGGADAKLAEAELAQAIEKMKKAVDAAKTLLPSDPVVRRYRVDALRIAGERSAARALVGEMPVSGKTLQDELTLAALDLAEDKPPWPTVIERLRGATAADGNLGRARAMLVYALAASGDVAGAKAEHDRLAALSRPHPLTAALLGFMARMDTDAPAAATSASAEASAAPSAAPTAEPATTAAGTAPPSTGASPPSAGTGTFSDGRVPDDYVAPGAGTVDVSDMKNHPPPPPHGPTTAPAPAPTTAPSPQPSAPPGVDTSDLPGFGKQ